MLSNQKILKFNKFVKKKIKVKEPISYLSKYGSPLSLSGCSARFIKLTRPEFSEKKVADFFSKKNKIPVIMKTEPCENGYSEERGCSRKALKIKIDKIFQNDNLSGDSSQRSSGMNSGRSYSKIDRIVIKKKKRKKNKKRRNLLGFLMNKEMSEINEISEKKENSRLQAIDIKGFIEKRSRKNSEKKIFLEPTYILGSKKEANKYIEATPSSGNNTPRKFMDAFNTISSKSVEKNLNLLSARKLKLKEGSSEDNETSRRSEERSRRLKEKLDVDFELDRFYGESKRISSECKGF